MMGWLPFTRFSPIGLDLGSHSFKAVQLKETRTGWEVAASVSLSRLSPDAPVDESEIERLQGVFDRRGFVGRDVVVALPTASLLTTILELPARAPGVPLNQIAAVEFARVHKQEAATMTMSTWELPAPARATKATYMLAVGAVSAKLESHMDLIESQGLNVLAIEEPSTAMVRGCQYLSDVSTGFTAVIDLGWELARLVILRDNTIVYTRKLSDSGLRRLNRMALEACGGDRDAVEHEIWRVGFDEHSSEDLENAAVLDLLGSYVTGAINEIVQAFSYTTHQYPDAVISRAFVVGGGAAIPGVAKRLESEMGVPTSVAGADRNSWNGEESWASVTSALGLALWTGEKR
jgi:Tfp pilus assembly PilM family ATPase